MRRSSIGFTFVAAVLSGGVVAPAVAAPPNWVSPPEAVSSASGATPSVVIDDAGNAHAAWTGPGPAFDVFAATRPAGGAWSTPQNVTGTVGGRAFAPRLAVNAAGTVVLVWLRDPVNGGTERIVEAAVRPAGATAFGALIPNGSTAAKFISQPLDVAIDAAGNGYVAWRNSTDTSYEVRKLVAGSTPAWEGSGPFVMEVSASTQPPAIAASPSGHVAAVYVQDSGVDLNVDWSLRGPGAPGWSVANDITADPAAETSADVDVSDNGTAYFTWASGAGPFTVRTAFAAAGTSIATVDGTVVETTTVAPNPRIAVDATGNARILYTDDDDGAGSALNPCDPLRMRVRAAAGGGLGAPVGLGNGTQADLEVNAEGDAVFTWNQSTNKGTFLSPDCGGNPVGSFAAHVRPAAGPGATITFPGANSPAHSINATGNAVAAVAASSSGDGIIQAAGYDNAAPVVSGLTVPANATPGQLLEMSVTAADAWLTGSTSWDFGDGTGAAGPAVTKRYAAAGTFTVTATHTDAVGFTASRTGRVTVAAPSASPAPSPSGPTQGLSSRARLRVSLAPPNFRVRALTLSNARGTRVSVRCTRGCGVNRARNVTAATTNLASLFTGKRLRLPAVIEVRFSRARTLGRYFRFTVRATGVRTRECRVSLSNRLTDCVNR